MTVPIYGQSKKYYLCNKKLFTSLSRACSYANAYFNKTKIVIAIEEVEAWV